jgi:hypothetical protein
MCLAILAVILVFLVFHQVSSIDATNVTFPDQGLDEASASIASFLILNSSSEATTITGSEMSTEEIMKQLLLDDSKKANNLETEENYESFYYDQTDNIQPATDAGKDTIIPNSIPTTPSNLLVKVFISRLKNLFNQQLTRTINSMRKGLLTLMKSHIIMVSSMLGIISANLKEFVEKLDDNQPISSIKINDNRTSVKITLNEDFRQQPTIQNDNIDQKDINDDDIEIIEL